MACIDMQEVTVLDENSEGLVRKWVVQLDDLIVLESLKIIKLSLRSELSYVQLESIVRVSDLYDALKRVYRNEQKIVARIMYALRMLGHRRYGYYALRKLTKTLHPDQFDTSFLPSSTDQSKFCLHQYLATLCVVLPQEHNEQFIKHFSKQLEINHNTVKTPCDMLTKMLEFNKINCENYEDLVEEAMIKAHLSDDTIQKCKERCGEISSCSNCSRYSSRTTLDSTASTIGDDSDHEGGSTVAVPLTIDDDDNDVRPITIVTGMRRESARLIEVQSADRGTSSSTGRRLVNHLRNRRHHLRTNKLNQPTSILHRRLFERLQNYCDRNCGSIAMIGVVFTGFFVCVVMLLSLGLVSTFVSSVDKDIATLYLSNTTAVIASSSASYSLQVIQDASFPGDDEHQIELFRVKAKCNKLPCLTDSYTKVGNNLTSINITTTYAWSGSSIVFNICGSTNQSTQRRLDAVVIKALDDLAFAKSMLPDYYNIYKGVYFIPGINGKWKCQEETVDIDESDYYTVFFLPRSTDDLFNYSVTYNIQSVDLTQLQNSITAMLHRDQDKWAAPRPLWFEHDFCVIAAINNIYNTSARGQVHIRTQYDSPGSPESGEATIIAAIALLLMGITIITVIVVCCKCCSKTKSVSFAD